jgi:pyridoxamine 5'-phosphate oxidase
MSDIDPIARFNHWFAQAQQAGAPLPEAAALATADATGRPAVRFVLIKQADDSGFVFFTNARSRKGRELRANPQAALAVYWDATGKQVRVDGRVEPVTAAEADAYWATRPRESQLAALASKQSAPIASHAELVARWEALRHQLQHQPIARPRGWTGFRIIPDSIELWTRGDHRLHHRELFVRTRRGWRHTLLQP